MFNRITACFLIFTIVFNVLRPEFDCTRKSKANMCLSPELNANCAVLINSGLDTTPVWRACLSQKVNVNVVRHEDWKKITEYVDAHTGIDYEGKYFYCAGLSVDKNRVEIFVTNSAQGRFRQIERDSFWQQRQEIMSVLSGHLKQSALNVDNASRDKFIRSIITQCNILKTPSNTFDSAMQEFLSVSQTQIEKNIIALSDHEKKYDISQYSQFGVNFKGYSHCQHFGYIYKQQIDWAKKLLAASANEKVVVIDDAAGSGHFLLALAKNLEVADEPRVGVIGTDIKDVDISFAVKTFDQGNYPNLTRSWLVGPEFDVTSQGYHQRILGKASGLFKSPHKKMLVLNHVIEHLNGIDPAEYIAGRLQGLDVVCISVPMLDPPLTSMSSHCCEYFPGSLGGYTRIGHNIELNKRKVGLEDLAAKVVELCDNRFEYDISAAQAGLLVFYKKTDHLYLVNKAQKMFGVDKVEALRAVFQSSWGRSIYPYETKKSPTTPANFIDVLKTLTALYEEHPYDRDIVLSIVTWLGFTKGVTSAANWAVYFDSAAIRLLFARWHANLLATRQVVSSSGVDANKLMPFVNVYAQWKTFLEFKQKAQQLTGKKDVCSYSGLSDEVYSKSTADSALEIEKQARFYYELADFIALGKEFELMRVPDQHIWNAVCAHNTEFLIQNMLCAYLYGQGQFVLKTNSLFAHAFGQDQGNQIQNIFASLIASLESSYQVLAPISKPVLRHVKTELLRFDEIISSGGSKPVSLNFERIFRFARQKTMRDTEQYLVARERQYKAFNPNSEPDCGQLPATLKDLFYKAYDVKKPAQSYAAAINFLLQSIALADNNNTFKKCIKLCSVLLLKSRKLSDDKALHDYRFLSLAIEYVGFYKLRYLSQRHRLYGFEAYAERLLWVADQMSRQKRQDRQKNFSREIFNELLETDEGGLWVQKWIFSYGPRRSVMFGIRKSADVESFNSDNSKTLLIDEKLSQITQNGHKSGLFGFVESGYTEKLRTLAFAGNEQVLDDLITGKMPVSGIADFLDTLNPFDPQDSFTMPLKAAAGVHVHNALKSDTAETMLALREIEWPGLNRVFATTSSTPQLADFERSLAIKFGVARLAVCNRQLLKAGNQNRTVINLPCDAYLTMDDDFRASPMALMHACAKLKHDSRAAYVQYPHTYRALSEPGHTRARHDNALYLFIFSVQYGPVFERTGFFFPLGTATVYRKEFWDSMGGVGVSPDANLIGEDLFVGLMSTMKASTKKLRWTHGVYPLETAIIGDGVDYKGTAKQQERYAESDSRLLRFVWMPFWLKGKNWTKVNLKRLSIGALVILHYLVTSSYSILFLFLAPLAEMFGVNTISSNWWYTFSFFASFACSVTIWRSWGCSVSETLASIRLLQFGCFQGMLKGAWVGLFTKPKGLWHASKSGKSANTTKFIHILAAAVTMGGAVVAFTVGRFFISPVFFAVSLVFLSLLFYDNLAPGSIEEKTNFLVKDASSNIRSRNKNSLLLNPVALWTSFIVQIFCTAILVVAIPGFAYVPMSVYVFAGIFFSINSILYARKNYINPETKESDFVNSRRYSLWKEALKHKNSSSGIIAYIKQDGVRVVQPIAWEKMTENLLENIPDFVRKSLFLHKGESVALKYVSDRRMEVFVCSADKKTRTFAGTLQLGDVLKFHGSELMLKQAA